MKSRHSNNKVQVFSAPQLAVANMVQGMLGLEGVDAEVRGESLGALAGAIPVDQSYAQVWVHADDVKAAKKIVAHLNESNDDEVLCPNCRERCPSSCTECWSCDASLQGAHLATGADSAEVSSAASGFNVDTTSVASFSGPWPLLACTLLVVSIVFCGLWLSTKAELDAANSILDVYRLTQPLR